MADVKSVPRVDLNRYLGRWYEVRRLPLKWEDETASDITANYSLSRSGGIRVDNRCFDAAGKPSQAIGDVTPVDKANARLKVTFLPRLLRWIPFTSGDYWILRLDDEYRAALVGSPDRKYLWVLSRTPSLPGEFLDDYLGEARLQGFDLSRLIVPRHTGREVTDAMLR